MLCLNIILGTCNLIPCTAEIRDLDSFVPLMKIHFYSLNVKMVITVII